MLDALTAKSPPKSFAAVYLRGLDYYCGGDSFHGLARSGYLEIALHASGVGDFNCSDDDPEHEKQRAEEQEPSDDSLDSVSLSGRSVSPRHELTSGQVCSKTAMGKCLVN